MLSPKRTKFRKYHRGKMRGFVNLSFKFESLSFFIKKFRNINTFLCYR